MDNKGMTSEASPKIEITDKVCQLCGTEIGVIHGILSNTYYCRNINCRSLPYSEPNEKGQEILYGA